MHRVKNWFCSGSKGHGKRYPLIWSRTHSSAVESNALDSTEDKAVWDEEEAGEEEADDELENEFDMAEED